MSVSIPDFWRLAVECRLLAPADCVRLEAEFAGVKGAANQSNAATLAEWLVTQKVLTHYHTRTLLAGQLGRFYYGDYYVYDRVRSKEGRLGGLLRAVHIPTRHPAMLCLVTGRAAEDPQWWQVAVQQVAWACSVGHPFVVQCYQLFELRRHKVVAIEDLLGGTPGVERAGSADNTFSARFTGGARLAPANACRVAYQVCLGLARLHQLGLVHGSVRPQNVWLHFDRSAKLLQTPLAPQPATAPGPVDWNAADPTGQLLAAADYAAPELAQAGQSPDMATDVYALGATLYQMLSGRPPFPDGDAASKLSRHASEAAPPLESRGVPQGIAQLVGYLMAKEPTGRYQTAMQAAEALAYFVDPAVANRIPAALPTAAAFDQWLDTQPRVPGVAAGAIPTASTLAAYSAAQNAAAQNPAEVPDPSPPTRSAELAASPLPQGERGDGNDARSESLQPAESLQAAEPSFLQSIQPEEPNFDPAGFAADAGETFADAAPANVQMAEPRAELDLSDVLAGASRKPAKRKSKRSSVTVAPKARLSTGVLVGLGGALAIILIFVGFMVVRGLRSGGSGDNSQVAVNSTTGNATTVPTASVQASPSKPATSTKPIKSAEHGSQPGAIQTVADDGVSLWASPTAGAPLPLDYVASDAQMILAVRPANILHRPDGDQVLASLGPWADMAAQAVKDASGLELNQVDQLMWVVHDSGDGKPVSTTIIRAMVPIVAEKQLPFWGNPAAVTEGNATYYQGAKLSYFLPGKEAGKVLVVGPAAQIKEVATPADGPRPMPRALELVMPHTDADRDVSLVFVQSYLFGDWRSIFAGPLSALERPMEDFFSSDVTAAQLSLHFQTNFFLELRGIGLPGKDPSMLADDLMRRLKATPTGLETDLDSLALHPYDRKLVRRLPEWLRLVTEYTRSGVEDDSPVLRCYLPSIAAPNLLMAGELALAEQPSQLATASTGLQRAQSIAELLKKRTTLAFPRDTLEKSLQLLFEDAGIKYEIVGGDLQLEGITKNQSFGLDEHDKTVEEILQKIMRLANPDGKLIYVVKPAAPGGPEMLFITTRAAAAKRGDKLPPALANAPGAAGNKKSLAKKKS